MKCKSNNKDQTSLRAGTFSTRLRNIRKALGENIGMNVPCGECDACCRSSYFIHIKAEETETLSRIPSKLLFPAPLHPEGHMILGYDMQGRCPMLVKNKCSIYRNRPATCRIFDCRILTASGIELEANTDNLISRQARRWKFNYPKKQDHDLHLAVQNAAKFLASHPKSIEDSFIPKEAIQLSVLAIKVYDAFLESNSTFDNAKRVTHEPDIAKKVLKSYEKFENQ